MNLPHLESSLDRLLKTVSRSTAQTLDRALSGQDISVDEATALFDADGSDLLAMIAAADHLRAQTVGDVVTYVINRNINFTNVCVKQCGFCAFSRGHLAEEGYFLPIEEIIRRAGEARDLGASEVCVQAGLAPGMDGWHYVKLCRAIKEAFPDLHVHGFSPEEVLYGSTLTGASIRDYLSALKDAGVGSLPGTSAEVFVDEVRQRISPGRISIDQWIDVIQTAHEVGIPTTSTIMYGHIETARHRAIHLNVLRDVQKRTGGITEFVPLGFVYEEAPMSHRKALPELRHGASGAEVMKMYAVSRLMLNNWIPNLQVSWVKEGPKLSQIAHADQRKHLHRRRLRLRPADEAVGISRFDPRDGPHSSGAFDDLSKSSHFRKRAQSPRPARRGERSGTTLRFVSKSHSSQRIPLPRFLPRAEKREKLTRCHDW
jgi:7,8-didemethyl-8-hydroxy-5-deazariboflavin synthase CofH subunit